MLGLKINHLIEYNIDNKFLMKPLDILIGVKHCQVQTIPLEIIMGKDYLYPYLTILKTHEGKRLSLQGTMEDSWKTSVTQEKVKGENYKWPVILRQDIRINS